jgi:hypothetical protein
MAVMELLLTVNDEWHCPSSGRVAKQPSRILGKHASLHKSRIPLLVRRECRTSPYWHYAVIADQI